MRPGWIVVPLATLGAVLLASAIHGASHEMAGLDAQGWPPERSGMASFVFGDFGGISAAALETNALPYKVMATALVMEAERRESRPLARRDLPRLLQRFGFLYPESLANWRGAPQPRFNRPLGLETGDVTAPLGLKIEVANLGCASCHGGALYDASGRPTRAAWLGLPNTSLDLEAYTRTVFGASRRATRDLAAFRQRIEQLFPEMGLGERLVLRWFVLPRVRSRIAALEAATGRPLPFSNGGPGRTNGVGALKFQVGLLGRERYDGAIGTTSIPAIASRGLRASLLYDGCYAVPGEARFATRAEADDTPRHRAALAAIVAFFTVPSMGIRPDRAERSIAEMERVMEFVSRSPSPPFPGPIDETLANQGRKVFEARCASCHGTYATGPPPCRLAACPNRLSTQEEMGTDAARWQAIDEPLLARLRATTFGRHIETARTGGYVGTILSGLWATAPYFHNGSVPTIWHLMHPAERPARFEVGGHRLDYVRLGIAGVTDSAGVYRYPPGDPPWSAPEIYDTRAYGLSNRGHEREFLDLSEAEKWALVEYLKCL